MTVFETERLIVREYTLEDADHFFILNGDERVVQYIRPPKSRAESDKFLVENIELYEKERGYGRWAAVDKQTGEFVGSFAVISIPNEPLKIQVGYALLPNQWGKGYATELTEEGVRYSFEQLGLKEVFGVTEIPNIASQKVLLKAGFVHSDTMTEGGKELLIFSLKQEKN